MVHGIDSLQSFVRGELLSLSVSAANVLDLPLFFQGYQFDEAAKNKVME